MDALGARFPLLCAYPDWAMLGAFDSDTLLGYAPGDEVQEGHRFFEVNSGEATTRRPHPERGS